MCFISVGYALDYSPHVSSCLFYSVYIDCCCLNGFHKDVVGRFNRLTLTVMTLGGPTIRVKVLSSMRQQRQIVVNTIARRNDKATDLSRE